MDLDLLSLELMKSSTKSDLSTGSADISTSSGKKIKRAHNHRLKIVAIRSPHVLELQDGFYMLTNCDLYTIPENDELAIPLSSQMYCCAYIL
jgi:hypothetical protein